MTAEQLEELLSRTDPENSAVSFNDWEQAEGELAYMAASLARRVIAAEKLVEAWFDESVSQSEFADMVNTYREASK